MAKQTAPKEVSLGICNFCQGQFAKNKMLQHLKSCRARLASINKDVEEKQRLFHVQVEGKYRPGYWMHLEVPAAATLAELDDFLRYIWLECCDHLSEFEIGGETYEYEPEDEWGMSLGGLSLVGASEANEDEEDEDEDEEEGEEPGMQEIATEMSRQLSLEFGTELKNVPPAEIEKKLEELFAANMPPGMAGGALPMLRPLLSQMAESLQQGTLAQDLEALEEEEEDEGGMQSELGEVLEVGEKFSYVYDFGSSSTLSLRVIDEREGVVPVVEDEEDEEDELEDGEDEIAIFIMGRNEPPTLVCHVCGQPATRVPSASEYDALAETALCDTHAAQTEHPDELLPIVNSPRTGICGYTGNEYEDDEEWDEDEDDEEDDEEE